MRRQWVSYALGASCLLITGQFAGCGSDAGGTPILTGSVTAVGGSSAPAAGTLAPPAGASGVGAAVATAGTGVSGTGTATAGTAAVAGTGVVAAGTGAAGTGAAGGGAAEMYSSCATADKTTPGPMLRAAAGTAIITQMGTCAFSSCHDMGAKKAKLILDTSAGTDLHDLTVGKPSCESPNLKLVDASGGDKALANSWLWQKLIAPSAPDGVLATKPDWGAPVNCGQASNQPFGVRMPFSGSDALLSPGSKLTAIRDWICAGAP